MIWNASFEFHFLKHHLPSKKKKKFCPQEQLVVPPEDTFDSYVLDFLI